MKYFAYGSNCNPAVMERKGVAFTSRARGTLPGYRLLFNKRAFRESLPEGIGFANVNPAEDASVEGIVYEVDDAHVQRLDESERYPDHYTRVAVTVETESGPQECETYQARPDKIADGLVPSRNYLNHILAGRDFLSRQYFEALDKSQTYTGECVVCHRHGEVLFLKETERMHTLCQPCREAKVIWGDTRGRKLTVVESEAVMAHVAHGGQSYQSVQDLIKSAIDQKLIDP